MPALRKELPGVLSALDAGEGVNIDSISVSIRQQRFANDNTTVPDMLLSALGLCLGPANICAKLFGWLLPIHGHETST